LPKSSKGLNAERIRQLAVSGAEALLKQLRAEVVAIERTFPELTDPATRKAFDRSVKTAQTRTRQMSAAARKQVSARMKKYWAERRKAKAAK
jgi:Holliday junction resolvasome RuvABC endonuclease subunit